MQVPVLVPVPRANSIAARKTSTTKTPPCAPVVMPIHKSPWTSPPCGHELAEHPGQQPRRNNDDARAVADAPHRRFAVFLFVFSEEDPNAQRDPLASPKGLGAAPLRNRQPDEPSHQYDERDQAAEQSAVHLKLLFLHEALLLIRLCVACILFYCRHSIIDNVRYRTP